MAAVKQSDEIQEYCAHGLRCENQHTYCWRWHTGGICFFSMCYDKPKGSGYCFKGDDCDLEHPKEYNNPNENLWILKNNKVFYFRDPKYKPEVIQDATGAPNVPAQEPAAEHKKSARAEKKAARKAAKKPASAESWYEIQQHTEQNAEQSANMSTEVTKHDTDNAPKVTKARTGTIVDMSTKSSWVAKVQAAQLAHTQASQQASQQQASQKASTQTVPQAEDFPELKAEQSKVEQSKVEQSKVEQSKAEQRAEKLYKQQTIETQAHQPPQDDQKAEQKADQQANQKAENKFSSKLHYITKNFLEENFDPVHFAELDSALQAEFVQLTAQLKLMQEQTTKLHKIKKAYAGYHEKDE